MKHGVHAAMMCLACFIFNVASGKPILWSMVSSLCGSLFYWAFMWVCDQWHDAGGGLL